MLMFLDDKEIQRLERELKLLNERGLPFATLATLNEAVMGGRERLRHNLERDFVLRNKGTAGSMAFRKARGRVMGRQAAELGSTSEYMAEQAEGFTRRAKGRHGIPIPTAFAGGQGAARVRTRPVRKAMRMGSIRLSRRVKGLSRKQRNIVATRQAMESGRRFVFLESAKSKGIYRVRGGSKKGSGFPKGAKLSLVWSLERTKYRVRKSMWLDFESRRTEKLMPGIYARRLMQQLRRVTATR